MNRLANITLALLVALVLAAPALGADLQSADKLDQAVYRGVTAAAPLTAENPNPSAASERSATCPAAVLVHNTSCNQINKAIERGRAPRGITRADKGNPNIPGNQDHIHFDDFGGTLNRDGTWGHDGPGSPTKSQLDWLRDNGWDV